MQKTLTSDHRLQTSDLRDSAKRGLRSEVSGLKSALVDALRNRVLGCRWIGIRLSSPCFKDISLTETSLKKTALNATHRQAGGKMAPFGGWDMPVQYSGTIDEHLTVRTAVGLFDVSHMGEVEVRGAQALPLVQHIGSNDASKLQVGQAQYSGLLTPQGTFVDDLLVHKISDEHFFLCINASNTDKDFAWMIENTRQFDAEVTNASPRFTQLALQGPQALATLQPLTEVELSAIKYYWFAHGTVSGVSALIARTGYTGEDGFEIYFDPHEAENIWHKLMAAGAAHGIKPCGLAARNTLRLEAKMALYGNDIDDTTTPYEADLAWIVKLQKGDFIGRDALVKQKAAGITRKLVGFEMTAPGIGRDHYPAWIGNQQVGHVTSGSPAPYLKKNIGLVYLPLAQTEIGTPFDIEIRGKRVAAQVVATPFYQRSK